MGCESKQVESEKCLRLNLKLIFCDESNVFVMNRIMTLSKCIVTFKIQIMCVNKISTLRYVIWSNRWILFYCFLFFIFQIFIDWLINFVFWFCCAERRNYLCRYQMVKRFRFCLTRMTKRIWLLLVKCSFWWNDLYFKLWT